PSAAQAMAKAMEVDPLDASTTVVPGWTRPSATARARTWEAMRSLVEPLGSWYSSLSQMVQPDSGSSQATAGVRAASRASRRPGSNVTPGCCPFPLRGASPGPVIITDNPAPGEPALPRTALAPRQPRR